MKNRSLDLIRISITWFCLSTAASAQTQFLEKLGRAMPASPVPEREDPRRVVGPGLFSQNPPLREAMSADATWFASTDANGNLQIRRADGEPELLAKAVGKDRWSVEGALWSPQADWLAVRTVDESEVGSFEITDRNGNPRTLRYSHAGTPLPRKQLHLLARDGSARRRVPLTLDYVYLAGWTSDGTSFRYLESDRTNRRIMLRSIERDTGSVRTLMEESSERWAVTGLYLGDGYSEMFQWINNLVFLDDDRFLWQSDRSGERHLWEHRTGTPARNLTRDLDGVLVKVLAAIPEQDVAVLLVAGDSPWSKRRVERLDLATGKRRLLFEAADVPYVEWSDGALFVVEAALPARFAEHRLDLDGAELEPPTVADLSFFAEEPFELRQLSLPAADGTTRLEALLVLPKGATAESRVPLIETIYGGPNTTIVPRMPFDRGLPEALLNASAGFATLFVDARGTPGRNAAFRHAQDGKFGATVIPDHAAALRALLAQEPAIDPDRVGIIGHSWGGHFALRAMIEAPELYKAAILLAPSIDASRMRVPIEVYQGCIPDECEEAYWQADLTRRLDRVRGPLLIVQGRADDDVLPMDVADVLPKLAKAGIEHEMIWLDRTDHIVQRDPDHRDRVLTFFRRTLRSR